MRRLVRMMELSGKQRRHAHASSARGRTTPATRAVCTPATRTSTAVVTAPQQPEQAAVWQRVAASIHNAAAAHQAAQLEAQPPAAPAASSEGRALRLHLGTLPLIEQRISVSNNSLSLGGAQGALRELVLIAPADVDETLQLYIDHDMQDADMYWTRAWPSAIALASIILERPELVAGKRVADLGAGLGLAGLAAALAGAAEVVLLDREPLALQCALLSALASAPAGMIHVEGLRLAAPGHVQDARQHPRDFCLHGPDLAPLLDRQQRHPDGTAPASPSSQGDAGSAGELGGAPQQQQQQQRRRRKTRVVPVPFDWNQGPEALLEQCAAAGGDGDGGRSRQQRFDVVLACDVLYESAAVEPISRLVPGILKADGGRLLLADPPNRTAHNRERFVELLGGGGGGATAQAGGGRARAARLVLEQCTVVDGCRVQQLDPEMVGGMAKSEVVPVQLVVFQSSLTANTVGLKSC